MGGWGHLGVSTSLSLNYCHIPQGTTSNFIVSTNTCFKLPEKWNVRAFESTWNRNILDVSIDMLHCTVDVLYAEWVGCWGPHGSWITWVNLCDPSTFYPTDTGSKLIHLSVTKQAKLPTNMGSGWGNQLLSLKWLTHLPLVPHICFSESRQHWFRQMACRLIGAKPISKPMLVYFQLDP